MALIIFNPVKHAGDTADCIYHVLLFAAVMLVFAIIAFALSSWAWMVAAFLGWGMVILGQVFFVFLWEPRGEDSAEDDATVKRLAVESRKITPGA